MKSPWTTLKLIIYNQSSKSSFVVISLAIGQVTGPVIEMEQKKEKWEQKEQKRDEAKIGFLWLQRSNYMFTPYDPMFGGLQLFVWKGLPQTESVARGSTYSITGALFTQHWGGEREVVSSMWAHTWPWYKVVESTNTTATLGATNSLCLDAKTLDLLVCPELRVAALALLPWQTTGNPVRRVHHCPGQALCASMIVKQRSCFYQASALSISSLLSETSAQEKN